MKLGIGTAQFGFDYGISNQEGKTSPEEVSRIIDIAVKNEIRFIDTAPAYGSSEEVLGKMLPPEHDFYIVTKTPKFAKNSITDDDAQFLENTFHQSLLKLNQSSLYGLLVHHVDDLLCENGSILFNKMLDMKEKGLLKKIGVSVYTQEQIQQIIEKYHIDLIQVPINIFDQRLLKNDYLKHLKELGVEIHARSIFLQGLLLMNVAELPAYFEKIKEHLINYQKSILKYGISTLESAINFVLCLNEIDVAICGFDHSHQMKEVIIAINKNLILSREHFASFAINDPSIINPSEWKL